MERLYYDGRTNIGGIAMNILVINGPNINLLGLREPELYGNRDYTALVEFIQAACAEVDVAVECMQSNHEGAIVDAIQAAYGRFDGAIEVHLTNIQEREAFRQVSYTAGACERTFAGMGFESYAEAIRYLAKKNT
jgi:3-dehydroquinate dehydratase-2